MIASNAASGENMDLQRELSAIWREMDSVSRSAEHLDQRYRDLFELLDDWRKKVKERDEGFEKLIKSLPADVLNIVELTIYALREERWKAEQAGVSSRAAPLLPPTPRPGSGAWAVGQQPPPRDEITSVFAIEHLDGTKKKALELLGGVVWWGIKRGWPFLLTAAGIAFTSWWHTHVR